MPGVEELLFTIVRELGLLGVFAASFLGASSIFIPIPYHVLVFWVAANTDYNIYAIMAMAGLGSASGEMVGYAAGYAAKRIFSERRRRRLDAALRILSRYKKLWPLLIFLFALTPLPDDLLFIPLGLVHFNMLHAFVPCLLGKLAMFYLLVAGGRYVGDISREYVGGGETTLIFTIASVAAFIIIVVAMAKIDWEKILAKYEKYMEHLQPSQRRED